MTSRPSVVSNVWIRFFMPLRRDATSLNPTSRWKKWPSSTTIWRLNITRSSMRTNVWIPSWPKCNGKPQHAISSWWNSIKSCSTYVMTVTLHRHSHIRSLPSSNIDITNSLRSTKVTVSLQSWTSASLLSSHQDNRVQIWRISKLPPMPSWSKIIWSWH